MRCPILLYIQLLLHIYTIILINLLSYYYSLIYILILCLNAGFYSCLESFALLLSGGWS